MDTKTVGTLKQLETAGTIPIILSLETLSEARLIDIQYEAIRIGFKVSPGVIDRRLDSLCDLNWIHKSKKEGSNLYTLTDKGREILNALKIFIKTIEK